MAEPYDVRPVTVADAEEYVACHVDCLAETYATIMPPAFAEEHRRDAPEQLRRTREACRSGSDPSSSWLARDGAGEVVGVVRSGPGQQSWEVELGAPTPSAPYQLHHLYTRQRTHGTGLGPQLLEVAVGDAHTYLWILHGNARADRFYRRQGFGPDGGAMNCGPTWFGRTMYRLVRPAP